MPGLIIPSRWTQQPQYPVDIDWSNPLTTGLQMLLVPQNGRLVDRVNRDRIWTANGNAAANKPTSNGIAATFDGTDDYYAVSLSYPEIVGNTGTFFIWCPRVGGGDTNGSVLIGTQSGATVFFQVSATNVPVVFGATANAGTVSWFNTSNSSLVMSSGGTAGTNKAYKNGVDSGATWAAAPTAFTTANKTIRFGAYTGGATFDCNMDAVIAGYSSRRWTDAEARAFHDAPWQFFRKQTRRIFFDVGAGGTHTTTGSLAAQSAAIAGTATRVAGAVTHTTSGALSAASATVSGTAVHTHVTSGALAAQSAIIVGVAERSVAGTHDTTGALSSGAAVISGTSAHIAIHATAGALSAQSAVIAGTSVKTSAGTGTGATVEEIWAYEIEPGVTAKMALQRLLAVMGGKVSGAGSGTETFRDINDTRDALISTNDSNGNRTGLTWNDGP